MWRKNKRKLAASIADCAKQGAELVILQELHNSLYFCQTENVNSFELAEPIPGPSTAFFGDLAGIMVSFWSARSLKSVQQASITIQLSFLTRMEVLPGNTGRCIFLMILDFMKSFISRRVILDLFRFRLPLGSWVFWFAGTSGIPKLPG